MNGKNANKVNRWGLEVTTYNITFERISGAKNKAADCLSHLVELPSTPSASINMFSVCSTDGSAFNTRSQTQQCLVPDPSTIQPNVTLDSTSTPDPTPKSLNSSQVRSPSPNAENGPFLQVDF